MDASGDAPFQPPVTDSSPGRRPAGPRRLRALVTGLAGVVLVGGIVAAFQTETFSKERAPVRPEPDVTLTAQNQGRPVHEVYAVATDVLANAGIEVDGRLLWRVGQVSLYGETPWEATGVLANPVAPPAGFPPSGYRARAAWATVPLAGEEIMHLTSYSVSGGLPLEQDYCSWWNNLATPAPISCVQTRRGDGLLIRLEELCTLTYIWSGGQVELRAPFSDAVGGVPPPWAAMEGVVTDPRLRW